MTNQEAEQLHELIAAARQRIKAEHSVDCISIDNDVRDAPLVCDCGHDRLAAAITRLDERVA